MWKRLQGHVREKDKQLQIGNPVLVETTYDQDQLGRNPDVPDSHKPDDQNYVIPPLDSLTISSVEPQSDQLSQVPTVPRVQRVSAVPTEPSIYSRASLEFYYYSNPAATLRSTYDDLSPPSSPEPEKFIPSFDPPSSSHSIRDISLRDFSPMDEKQRKLQDEPRDPTTAPVLRRAPSVLRTGEVQSGPKQKFWEGKLAPNSKVKWDEYSGEPNIAGKAPSVDPGSYVIGGPSASLRPMGYQVSVTAAAATEKKSLSFGERLTRFGSKRSPTVPAAVKQRLAEKSLQIPQRTASPSSDRSRSNTPTPTLDLTPKVSDTQPVTVQTVNLELHEQTIKPVVPLKVEKKSPAGSHLTSPTSPAAYGLGISAFAYPSPLTPKTRDDEKRSPAIIIGAEPPAHPAFRTATPPETDKPPIASQFSWSKYTHTATTDEHSPPPSPPLSASSSILLRRRPVGHADRIPDSRPGNSKMLIPSGASTYSTVSAMSNTSKALPHPPTALCALDHIALLESQQEDLRIRRNNVYRLLSDLNNAAPPNPLLTDFKKAKAVENKKKVFEVELDEIKREEHEVGLKLHRAWKKREKEDPNAAGSALWVRRVTS